MEKSTKFNFISAVLLLFTALYLPYTMTMTGFGLVAASVLGIITCNKPNKKATIIIMAILMVLVFVDMILEFARLGALINMAQHNWSSILIVVIRYTLVLGLMAFALAKMINIKALYVVAIAFASAWVFWASTHDLINIITEVSRSGLEYYEIIEFYWEDIVYIYFFGVLLVLAFAFSAIGLASYKKELAAITE